MIYFYCTSWQFFQMIVKWRISPTTEQIMFTFSILLFHFYSHIPCGMWLSYIWSIKITKIISTHTSRVGCDYNHRVFLSAYENFYSHIPCGMWQEIEAVWNCSIVFLLTHPVWDVTPFLYIISINPINFYSHIPCGMWLLGSLFYANDYLFLLTHPVWDVTAAGQSFRRLLLNFYSHIPCGMWHKRSGADVHDNWNFYSHIPCGMWL